MSDQLHIKLVVSFFPWLCSLDLLHLSLSPVPSLTLLCLSLTLHFVAGTMATSTCSPHPPSLQGPPGSQASPHAQLPPNSNMMGAHGQVTAHTVSLLISVRHTFCPPPPPPSPCQLLYRLHC